MKPILFKDVPILSIFYYHGDLCPRLKITDSTCVDYGLNELSVNPGVLVFIK